MPIVFYCSAIYSVLTSLFVKYDIHFANVFSVCKITEIITKKPWQCGYLLCMTCVFILFCFGIYREENDNEDEVEFTTKLGNNIIVLQEDSAFGNCMVISDPNKSSVFLL